MPVNNTLLKSAQVGAIHRLLALNDEDMDVKELPPAGSVHNEWKILIYDSHCQSIISPILSVQQLRRRGVTLHLLLESDREPIPDVPAIYFCRPTKENLARIASDVGRNLYQSAHLNFCSKIDRTALEDFAKLVVQTGSLSKIASVHDQYLDFCCMEERLFSLSHKNSYARINSSGTTEQEMESYMMEIAHGLFSVVATLGQIPVIRSPRNGAPEMVSRLLHKMIIDHPTLIRQKTSLSRPLLVILDRNSDLITPIQHTSTYQALMDDMLQHKANRVEFQMIVDPDAKRIQKVTKKFDLDADEDAFYAAHKFQAFPEAIESNGLELQQVTEKEQAIRSKAAGGSNSDPLTGAAADLAHAVDSLPALLERKKQLEMHTSILQAVMTQVADRDVPQFYELESGLATGSYRNDLPKAKALVLELLQDTTKGNAHDKLRLVLVYALATKASSGDLDEVQSALDNLPLEGEEKKRISAGMQAIRYVKQLRLHMSDNMFQQMSSETSGSTNESSTLSSFMAKASSQATGLLAKATDRVSGMLGKIHKHHATVVVEQLCQNESESDMSYLYLDPKVKGGDVDVSKLPAHRAPVQKVIVFCVGGGCYGEYQNLQMLNLQICYGSTELLDAGGFLKQLGDLGQ